jgi:predicted transcriptional regulator
MEIEKGKTARYLKEKREVSSAVTDNLKQFNQIKKNILEALKEEDLTVDQLTLKLNRPKHEVLYYLMSLIKYGFVTAGVVDDRDEYFSYKIKKT